MDELLLALRLGDSVKVASLAKELFVEDSGRLNQAATNEFEKYAPCAITQQQSTIYKKRCYNGFISYNGSVYTF